MQTKKQWGERGENHFIRRPTLAISISSQIFFWTNSLPRKNDGYGEWEPSGIANFEPFLRVLSLLSDSLLQLFLWGFDDHVTLADAHMAANFILWSIFNSSKIQDTCTVYSSLISAFFLSKRELSSPEPEESGSEEGLIWLYLFESISSNQMSE
jgi:hypothetical protein